MFAEPPPLQPNRPPVPVHIWRGRDVLFGFGLLIASFLVISIAIFGLDHWLTPDKRELVALGFVITIIWEAFFASVVLVFARRRGATLRDLGFRKPERWGPLPVIVVGAYGSLIGYAVLIEYLERLGLNLSWIEGGNQVEIPEEHSTFPLALLLVVIGFAVMFTAPLAEELFFRGLVYRALGERWSPFPALLVSGFLFSAFHLNPAVLIPFTVLGMLLAWGFRSSGSIWVPIATHFIINTVSFTVTVYGVLK